MTEEATPAKVRLTDGLGPPLEDALKRAYYYTEAGEWRGPGADEWDRWHAVAKVAAALVEAERERCARLLDAAHEQRKHLDNYAAYYARMIRECRLIDGPNGMLTAPTEAQRTES